MSCPDLTSVLTHHEPVQVSLKTQVREVAKLMKEYHTTAVLVMDHNGLAGIFTVNNIAFILCIVFIFYFPASLGGSARQTP